MSNFGKNLALWVIIGLLLIALFNLFQNSSSKREPNKLAYSDFIQRVEKGQVKDVTIAGQNISGHLTDNTPFSTVKPLSSRMPVT